MGAYLGSILKKEDDEVMQKLNELIVRKENDEVMRKLNALEEKLGEVAGDVQAQREEIRATPDQALMEQQDQVLVAQNGPAMATINFSFEPPVGAQQWATTWNRRQLLPTTINSRKFREWMTRIPPETAAIFRTLQTNVPQQPNPVYELCFAIMLEMYMREP
jgi:hypothetical protein